MSAKTTLPGQHEVLHERWPADCCLCTHEARIAELEAENAALQKAFDFAVRVNELGRVAVIADLRETLRRSEVERDALAAQVETLKEVGEGLREELADYKNQYDQDALG